MRASEQLRFRAHELAVMAKTGILPGGYVDSILRDAPAVYR
jgi:hypothetical protein